MSSALVLSSVLSSFGGACTADGVLLACTFFRSRRGMPFRVRRRRAFLGFSTLMTQGVCAPEVKVQKKQKKPEENLRT